jgi:hypothetical protein
LGERKEAERVIGPWVPGRAWREGPSSIAMPPHGQLVAAGKRTGVRVSWAEAGGVIAPYGLGLSDVAGHVGRCSGQ